jgi:hypothetical protein
VARLKVGWDSHKTRPSITLVHSRDQLLLHFGPRLHEHVVEAFNKLGIEIIFQERPQTLPGIDSTSPSLLFSDGRTEEFDQIGMFHLY